jgi:hypothetical protein
MVFPISQACGVFEFDLEKLRDTADERFSDAEGLSHSSKIAECRVSQL